MHSRSREGLAQLTNSVLDDINNLIAALVESSGVQLNDIIYMMCAGNTTMIHMLLGLDPSHIRLEPYTPAVTTPPVIRAAEVGHSH